MTKIRVILLPVGHQKLTVREVVEKYAVSERWIYMLLAKYREGGIDELVATVTHANTGEVLNNPLN